MRWSRILAPAVAVLSGCAGSPAPPGSGPPARAFTVEEMARENPDPGSPHRMDLSPARWIWFPSARTLPNTFVLFRREFSIARQPLRSHGWITADSRYRLTLDGRPLQWGPAPSDPRALDVDPVNLTSLLTPGRHVLGIEVLFYGRGDGTWVAGKPGLLVHLRLEYPEGQTETLVSDERWQAFLDRAHPPGHYARWYLRALQEDFDARLHPWGWDTPGFLADARWLPAMVLDGRPDQPTIATRYPDALEDQMANTTGTCLLSRQVPILEYRDIPAFRLADSAALKWSRDPADWFESRTPGSFEILPGTIAREMEPGVWELPATSSLATFEFKEQLVGWPHVTIDAPEGTTIELMIQESHDPARTRWLDTHFFAWSRFVSDGHPRRFECFDYECLRWLQIHVHHHSRPVRISDVGVVRRRYPWPHAPGIETKDSRLQKLFDACLHTLELSVQDHIVDGMGRERQQYPGDAGHQQVAVRYAFGETRASRRFLRTFSEGLTLEGVFMDSWPSTDRLRRIAQRQIGTFRYGPMVDEGIGFVFDCWSYYLETGDLDGLREPWPRILVFARTVAGFRRADGLLPVEDFGTPSVWMDRNDCYPRQRQKMCAYNLYAAAMFREALAPIARAFGDEASAAWAEGVSHELLQATIGAFWSEERGLFVNNLPWLSDEKTPRLCDRSLAMALLFGFCPGGRTEPSLRALADPPTSMGLSYPANTVWRHRALCQSGRPEVVLREYRERWAALPSVLENNTVQETWTVRAGTTDEWSHCGVVPLEILFTDLLGLRPLAPGFGRVEIRPRLGDLGPLRARAYTPVGAFDFSVEPTPRGPRLVVTAPDGVHGTLVLPSGPRTLLPGRNEALLD